MGLAKTFLAIGIAIIFALFIGYGLHIVYEVPKYDYTIGGNECSIQYNCQKQIQLCQERHKPSDQEYQNCWSKVRESQAYKVCLELRDKCNEEYQKQTPRYKHARNTFFILAVIGVIAIIVGVLLTSLEGIGSGFMGGGILIIIYALFRTWEYWFKLNKYAKLGILAVVLIILIYLGYKKLEKKI